MTWPPTFRATCRAWTSAPGRMTAGSDRAQVESPTSATAARVVRTMPLRQLGRRALAPVVEEEEARLVVEHVIVEGDHVDARGPKGADHGLYFFGPHDEVSVDSRPNVAPRKGCPRREAHRSTDRHAVRTSLARNRHLDDTPLTDRRLIENLPEASGIERARARRIPRK